MRIQKEHLLRAQHRGVLAEGGAERLWEDLSQQIAEAPAFRAQHVLYYAGALLMLLPLTLFISKGFLRLGDAGLLAFALATGAATWWAAVRLLNGGRRIAAGTFAVVSLSLVPLAVFSLMHLAGVDFADSHGRGYAGFHRLISAEFIVVEIATLLAASLYLKRFSLPFLMLPISTIVWYLGMDATSLVTGSDLFVHARAWGFVYGGAVMVAAWLVDRATRHTLSDFSFWPWLMGTSVFWVSLSSDDGGELAKLTYAGANLVLVVLSVVVGRRVLAVFGAMGLTWYLGHLSLKLFAGALTFPFVTLVLGAALVMAGLKWPRIESAIAGRLGVQR